MPQGNEYQMSSFDPQRELKYTYVLRDKLKIKARKVVCEGVWGVVKHSTSFVSLYVVHVFTIFQVS